MCKKMFTKEEIEEWEKKVIKELKAHTKSVFDQIEETDNGR